MLSLLSGRHLLIMEVDRILAALGEIYFLMGSCIKYISPYSKVAIEFVASYPTSHSGQKNAKARKHVQGWGGSHRVRLAARRSGTDRIVACDRNEPERK